MREVQQQYLRDKTGTLTRGEHVVTGVAAADGDHHYPLLALAAAVEADSEHPLARAIVRRAENAELAMPRASQPFAPSPGAGWRQQSKDRDVAIGKPNMLRERGLTRPGSAV